MKPGIFERTEVIRKRMSEAQKNRYKKLTKEEKKKLFKYSYNLKGKTYEEIFGQEKAKLIKEKISRSVNKKNSKLTPEIRKIKFGNKGIKNPFYRKTHTKENIEKMKKAHDDWWNGMSFEEKEKHMKRIFEVQKKRPTNLEKNLIQNIIRNNLPYKYVGDGQVWFGCKNPDFMNSNGQKKLIELFGDTYHHKLEEVEPRVNHFKQYGFDTLVIWGEEMKDMNKVLDKIREFDGGN